MSALPLMADMIGKALIQRATRMTAPPFFVMRVLD